jgi:RNA polymerase sigma-70 factor (ECF subfamily)
MESASLGCDVPGLHERLHGRTGGVEVDVPARAFDALVAEHRERAVRLAWRMVGGDRAAAEDIAQEAFVRAYRGLGRFRGESSLTTWFYRILLNEVQRRRRWRWIRERAAGPMPADPPDAGAAGQGDPLLRARIGRALETLSRAQREAFVLVHLEGFSVSEAAELTGRAAGTLKSHLHRALVALRDELADLAPAAEAGR